MRCVPPTTGDSNLKGDRLENKPSGRTARLEVTRAEPRYPSIGRKVLRSITYAICSNGTIAEVVGCPQPVTPSLFPVIIVYNVNIAAIREVMPLAVKAGLKPGKPAEVLTTASARSFASEYFVPRILARQFDGDYSMQAAYKDIVNIQQVAAQFQAAMPIVDAMVSTYQAAIDMGFGEQPKSAMVKVYEKHLGQEVCLLEGDNS